MAELNKAGLQTKIIGTRHGEKLYETLLSVKSGPTPKTRNIFVLPDMRGRAIINTLMGQQSISKAEDFNSHNTKLLNVAEMPLLKNHLVHAATKAVQLNLWGERWTYLSLGLMGSLAGI